MCRASVRRLHRPTLSLVGAVVGFLLLIVGPAFAQGPYEPNDSIAQAHGPLVGGVPYSGAQETQNDQDWFTFHTSGQVQLDITVTTVTGGCWHAYDLLNEQGSLLGQAVFGPGYSDHIRYTSPTAARLYLLIYGGCVDNTYEFRIDPADAVTATAPGSGAPPQGPTPQPGQPAGAVPSARDLLKVADGIRKMVTGWNTVCKYLAECARWPKTNVGKAIDALDKVTTVGSLARAVALSIQLGDDLKALNQAVKQHCKNNACARGHYPPEVRRAARKAEKTVLALRAALLAAVPIPGFEDLFPPP